MVTTPTITIMAAIATMIQRRHAAPLTTATGSPTCKLSLGLHSLTPYPQFTIAGQLGQEPTMSELQPQRAPCRISTHTVHLFAPLLADLICRYQGAGLQLSNTCLRHCLGCSSTFSVKGIDHENTSGRWDKKKPGGKKKWCVPSDYDALITILMATRTGNEHSW